MNEITFSTLNENFDAICNQVNNDKEAVTLTLKSNRKVYIMPEENYDQISHFMITRMTINNCTSAK